MSIRKMKSKLLGRTITLDEDDIRQVSEATDTEPARYEFPISSETPVERWFGVEILDHKRGSVNLERFNSGGAAVRDEHWGDQVGVIEKAWIKERRVWVRMFFSQANPRAQVIEKDVQAKVRRNVSPGYIPGPMDEESTDGGKRTYRRKNWTPIHLAIVADPADHTVGVGRSAGDDTEYEFDVEERDGEPVAKNREERTMKKKVRDAATGAIVEVDETDPRPVYVERSAAEILEERKNANAEALEIRRVAISNGLSEKEADEIASSGLTRDQAKVKIFDLLTERNAGKDPVRPNLSIDGPGEKERRAYSFADAAQQAYAVREGRASKFTGAAGEWHQELEKTWKGERHAGGILVPLRTKSEEMLERELGLRTMGTGEPTGGAALIGQQYMDLIELLQNEALCLAFGAQFYPGMQAPAYWAKETGAPTVYWMGENPPAPVTKSDYLSDYVQSTPKTLMGRVEQPKQLMVMSRYDTEARIRQLLAEGHGLALDRGALTGPGTANQPLGLLNTPGVLSESLSASPTYAQLWKMIVKPAKRNVRRGGFRWMTEPGLVGKLATTQKVSGQEAMLWEGTVDEGVMAGYRGASTNQLPDNLGTGTDESALLFGAWQFLALLMWGNAIEVTVDNITLADVAQVKIVSFGMGDSVCLRPEAFVKGSGAKAA